MNHKDFLFSSVSLFAVTSIAHCGLANKAQAADVGVAARADGLPAVSDVNAKVGAFGGAVSEEGAGGGYFALALPLGQRFGAQVDALGGRGDGQPFYGLGAHLFWRDPSIGLLGAYGSTVRWDVDTSRGDIEVGKVGLEGQLYLGQFTLDGLGAYQFGTFDGFTGKAGLAYYPIDDLRLDIGVAYYEGPDLIGYAGLEWMPLPDRPLSIFAKGSISEHNDEASSILGGLKFYFSPETKSLIRRHREDDPDVDLASDLYLAPQLPPDLFQTANGVCPPGEVLVNGSCDGNT